MILLRNNKKKQIKIYKNKVITIKINNKYFYNKILKN